MVLGHHPKAYRHMMRNLVSSLILHERITTTYGKVAHCWLRQNVLWELPTNLLTSPRGLREAKPVQSISLREEYLLTRFLKSWWWKQSPSWKTSLKIMSPFPSKLFADVVTMPLSSLLLSETARRRKFQRCRPRNSKRKLSKSTPKTSAARSSPKRKPTMNSCFAKNPRCRNFWSAKSRGWSSTNGHSISLATRNAFSCLCEGHLIS